MKRFILFFLPIFIFQFNSFGQTNNSAFNINGNWQLEVMRDTSGAMIDFTGSTEPHFYKNLMLKKNKVVLSHYSEKIKGTWTLTNNLLQISFNDKMLQYRIHTDRNNNLILEKDILLDDSSTFTALGYYKKQ